MFIWIELIIENSERIWEQLFMKIQLSTFMISANFKIWQFMKRGVMSTLDGAEFIVLSDFSGE